MSNQNSSMATVKQKINQPPGLPSRFEQITVRPMKHELTLLIDQEATNPGTVDLERHARTLLALAYKAFGQDPELWNRFGITLHVIVRDCIFPNFLGFLKSEQMDYEMYRELGIETIDDALDARTVRDAFYATWDAFLDRDVGHDQLFDAEQFDLRLCELLCTLDVLDYEYLRNRPTVAEPEKYFTESSILDEYQILEARERIASYHRDSVNRLTDRENYLGRTLEGLETLHVTRQPNTGNRKWTMVPEYEVEPLEKLLSRCEGRMGGKGYQETMTEIIAHYSFCQVKNDLRDEWLAVGNIGQLENIGLEGPADLLQYEPVVGAYKTMAVCMMENQELIGPYTQYTQEVAAKARDRLEILAQEEYEELRSVDRPWVTGEEGSTEDPPRPEGPQPQHGGQESGNGDSRLADHLPNLDDLSL